MGSGKAGFYRPGFPRRSWPKANAEFLLAVEMGGCGEDWEWMLVLWYTVVLFIWAGSLASW